jgi:hypothetical protein
MPELVVDDTPILGDQGDIFEIDEDFDPPAGSSTRYVSDIHNPKGKPQRRVRVCTRGVPCAYGRGDHTRSPREYALICPLTTAGAPGAAFRHA